MSTAAINQLGFEPPKTVQNRIKAGQALVWLFAMISTTVTLFYWYSLSGLEYSGDENLIKNVIRWFSVGLGLALELAKLYFIFVGGYKKLWISAVIISVITVMGSYSILNQDRQNNLTKASDTYKDARSAREEARKKQAKYAYVASTTIDDLQAELEANNKKGGSNKARRLSGMSYQSFVQKRADINKRIEARRKYDSATATLEAENKNMQKQGLGGSSNPLFNSIGQVFSSTAKQAQKIEGAILILFFFATSVLAEIFAYFIGEKVRQETNNAFLTQAQMQDLKNKELFGVAVSEIMPEQFARLNDAQRDRIEADAVIQKLRLTKKDEKGNDLSLSETSKKVRETRSELESASKDARDRAELNFRKGSKEEIIVAPALRPDGGLMSDAQQQQYIKDKQAKQANDDIKARYDKAKSAKKGDLIICPTCEKEFTKPHHRTIFCSSTGKSNCKDGYHNILNPDRLNARRSK